MTRCVIHCPLPAYVDAWLDITAASIEITRAVQLPDFGSALFRDPEAVGLIWCVDWIDAAETIGDYRQAEIKNPILVIIEQGNSPIKAAKDRAQVLRAGADDVQPSTIMGAEIVAQLKALAGRGAYFDHLHVPLPNGCTFIHEQQIIRGPIEDVRLTGKETELLSLLARHPNVTMTKQAIMDDLYGGEEEPNIKIVDVWVCKLRAKIMRATGGVDCVQNEWGRGYYFVPKGFVPELITLRASRARQVAR